MPRHILTIPFRYHVEAVPPRHRISRRFVFLGRVPVSVPEVDPEGVPVAVAATMPNGRRVDYRRTAEGGFLRPVWFPGAAGAEMSPFLKAADAEARIEAAVAALPAKGMAWPLLNESEPYRSGMRPPAEEGNTDVIRRIERSDRIQREAAAREFYRGAAFVGGILHVPSLGPAWRIVKTRDGNGEVRRLKLQPELAHVAAAERGRTGFQWDQEFLAAARLRENDAGVPIGATLGAAAHGEEPGSEEEAARRLVEGLASDAAVAARWLLGATKYSVTDMSPDAIHAFAEIKAGLPTGEAEPLPTEPEAIRAVVRPMIRLHAALADKQRWKADQADDPVSRFLERVRQEREASCPATDAGPPAPR